MKHSNSAWIWGLWAACLGLFLQGCLLQKDDGEAAASFAGKWQYADYDQGADKLTVRTTQFEFLPNGKLKGFVEVREEAGGISTVTSLDTLGDSSRYEKDVPLPGWLQVWNHVLPGSDECPGVHAGWSRYQLQGNVLRLFVVQDYEGASPSLVGTWTKGSCRMSEGAAIYSMQVREFSAGGNLTVRQFDLNGAGKDTLSATFTYADSGSFFVVPTSLQGAMRQYYRIDSGRLFVYYDDSAASFSSSLARVK